VGLNKATRLIWAKGSSNDITSKSGFSEIA